MNGLAAPDVRAPSVRGRWHFGAGFGPFSPDQMHSRLRLGIASGCGYTLALMNDAIKPGPENPPQAAGLPQLSVVVPTFNERDNVTVLYRRLEATLKDIPWEVVFVDDNSPDGTWEVVRGLARQDSRVRCIRRIGRRGLSGACIEGILASSAPYAAVIDADLQHDETQLPKMVGAAAKRRGGTRGRQPLYRGRQRRQFRQGPRPASARSRPKSPSAC